MIRGRESATARSDGTEGLQQSRGVRTYDRRRVGATFDTRHAVDSILPFESARPVGNQKAEIGAVHDAAQVEVGGSGTTPLREQGAQIEAVDCAVTVKIR